MMHTTEPSATDHPLLDRVTPTERERAFTVLRELLPISARVRGIVCSASQNSRSELSSRRTSHACSG